jgi:hypothetical protein
LVSLGFLFPTPAPQFVQSHIPAQLNSLENPSFILRKSDFPNPAGPGEFPILLSSLESGRILNEDQFVSKSSPEFLTCKLDLGKSNHFQEDFKIQEIRFLSNQNPPEIDFQKNVPVSIESSESL